MIALFFSQTAWRNYAPTGAIRLNDDHDKNSSVWKDEVEILMCIKKARITMFEGIRQEYQCFKK